jgi:antitoxin component YwqK of YwqJK toxin-antitoxin module
MTKDSVPLIGSQKIYFSDSVLAVDAAFIDGNLDGNVRLYYSNGVLSEEGVE